MDEKQTGNHGYTLKNRSELQISGVVDVGSFDDKTVFLTTALGNMAVEGEELRIGTLSLDRGEVILTGKVNGVYYYEPTQNREKGGKGFFSRLLR